MQKWEYVAIENLTQSLLNHYGEKGWELVAVTCRDNGTPEVFYLKRRKE